jgi:hypothetical protein
MKITLPKDVLGKLPQPDAQGLVRVSAALKMTSGGGMELVEINDEPVGKENDDDEPMPQGDLPDLSKADIYSP